MDGRRHRYAPEAAFGQVRISGSSPAPLERGDDDLIRRFLDSRDEQAFRELYRRHTPAVYGLVCRLTGGRLADAADLVQTAWIRAAGKLAAFEGGSTFRTWLTGIAVNCYREWRRAAATRADAGRDGVEAGRVAAASDARTMDIAEVLARMPAALREVIVLHDVEGHTHAEIAAALEIETGTSKSRLSRARRMFRATWQAEVPEGHHD